MKTLIVYRTHHGTTRNVVEILKGLLNGQVVTLNLKKNSSPSLDEYSAIIIGGSIHVGQVQKDIRKFCNINAEVLKTKELGLFLCCMEEGDVAGKQFDDAFPDDLRRKSKANGLFGGQFLLEKMNFVEKMVVKKVAGVDKNISKINVSAIEKFADEFNKQVS